MQLGLHDEAEQVVRACLRKQPSHPEVLHGLGLVLLARDKPREAEVFFAQAIVKEPRRPSYFVNHALSLAKIGEADKAIAALRRAVELKTDFVDAWFNLAVLSSRQQAHVEAERCYRKVLAIDPGHVASLNNLADWLAQSGRHKEAAPLFRRALALRPDFIDAKYNFARMLLDEYPGDAARLLAEVVAARPTFIDAVRLHARALARSGEYEAALDVLDQTVNCAPDSAELLNDLGLVRLETGRLEAAAAAFESAVALDPDHAYALYNLAFAVKGKGDPHLLERIQQSLLRTQARPDDEQALLYFASGHLHEAAGDFDRAFEAFDRANSLKRVDYQRAQTEHLFASIRSVFNSTFFDRPEAGCDDGTPIFIVGMPRSGTTLVEQIIASHPEVEGAGELLWFNQLSDRLPDDVGADLPFPECARLITPELRGTFAAAYLAELRRRGGTQVRHISDKMPGNFVHLGLIATLFPNARIIHCVRDPLDTALSCFTSHFTGFLPYAYSQQDLGHYYRCYQDLMRHWETVLPRAPYRLQYEALTADPERQIRALIDYLGLPWDERCLAPHLSTRAVATASSVQVRAPIHRASVSRSTRFGRHLDPLRRALNLPPG